MLIGLGDVSHLTFRSLKFEINELFIKEELAKMYTSPQAHSAVLEQVSVSHSGR